ncbi:CHC2 zinc finger domain-containing protein [Mediterraneibacter faecis]|uniref:CHC2 zinc finger domain-containing protein n=1 Tax=Mediterraneibacter faecis TaxID=592978 RepID=UPI003F958685
MNIFQKVKERVTARQVAEKYGLKVRQNGMACCPFHNDKHPSMKIDRNYYCFSCGAKGDGWNSGMSFTNRNLWKRNGIRYLPKLYRMKARSVFWWTY